MPSNTALDLFLATAPGLEPILHQELDDLGFRDARPTAGGVTMTGSWPDVWRANLEVRGASRVLVRIASFPAMHLAQLDKRARKVPWGDVLRADVPFRVEATCRSSKIYHSGAARERIERAISEELGAPLARDATVCVRLRVENNLCTLSVDTSGELLHKRGHKEAVSKAPMRETMASLFLRQCGFDGQEPVVDPMCGSGTFVIEAAERAAGLKPGRSRTFAFQDLATFDADQWRALLDADERPNLEAGARYFGSDRDAGAIRMSKANAERASVTPWTDFQAVSVADVCPPIDEPGLVIINPPYGTRISDKKKLTPVYRSLGATLMERFAGWRVGLITTDTSLAKATGLPFKQPGPPVAHGGLNVRLFQTGVLG